MFPKYIPKTEFTRLFGANLVSGGRAAAGRLGIAYTPDHMRSIGGTDMGRGPLALYAGLGIIKTAVGRGPLALYTGLGVSVVGVYLDTITGPNPWKDKGSKGAASTSAAAQTAIIIGAGATYSFDTVRRRPQMLSEKPAEEHFYKDTMDRFKKTAAFPWRGGSI